LTITLGAHAGENLDTLRKRNLRRREVVLASYLKLEAASPLLDALRACSDTRPGEDKLNEAVAACASALRGEAAPVDQPLPGQESLAEPPVSLDEERRAILPDAIGWHGRFCTLTLGGPADQHSLDSEIFVAAERTFRRFLFSFTIALVLGLSGLVFLAVYLFWFFSGRANFQFGPAGAAAPWCLEAFALYLLLYIALGKAAAPAMEWLIARGFEPNRLLVSAGVIVVLPITLLWPIIAGKFSWHEVRSSIGLRIDSAVRVLQDLLIAPTFYLASWTVLAAVLIVYSLVLQWLNVDISQGTHPVVPILLGSSDAQTKIAIIALAVGIAPIVEEIMFRGALYSWLRSRTPAWLAIPISAFIFASVHPQGPVGLVPLTAIGMILAFLREWRGSLVAPMLTHACVNGGTMIVLMMLME
jgi:membrane protease YdiL (CAAX protease family)